MNFPRIASLKSHHQFVSHLRSLGLDLPVDETVETGREAPLARAMRVHSRWVGNRFCILPMEGWDGTGDGKPTDLTRRRWRNFGISGAKMIWGGEAVAVEHAGRANPNQLLIKDENLSAIESLRGELVSAHEERFGSTNDLMIGLQLTHSGRWSRPNDKTTAEPRTAQRNASLDAKLKIDGDDAVLTDDDLKRLIERFVAAAVASQKMGFDFVDIKHCHGYLGHEILSGVDRPGPFGGSFKNRTRFLRTIIEGIAAEAPDLIVGVRLTMFDFLPFVPDEDNVGTPDTQGDSRLQFGCDPSGLAVDLNPASEVLSLLESLGVKLVCTSAGSPYYNPHIQRPAAFPPSDGYRPPEDPLVGVDRQVQATAALKSMHPKMAFVGSGYTYLQEWVPGVAQAVVREGLADFIGLGRMVLSYPDLPADVLSGQSMPRKKVCRTFSDCTTAPRNGLISGCYPLDPFYKERPEREQLLTLKK